MRKRRRDERQRWAPSELDVPPTMHQHGRAMELSNATRWLCCRVSRSLRTVSPPIQYHADVAVVVCRPPSLAGGRSLLFLGGSGWRCCSRAGSRGAGGRYGVAFRPLMRAAIGQDQKRSSPIRRRRREPPAPSSPHSPLRATWPALLRGSNGTRPQPTCSSRPVTRGGARSRSYSRMEPRRLSAEGSASHRLRWLMRPSPFF